MAELICQGNCHCLQYYATQPLAGLLAPGTEQLTANGGIPEATARTVDFRVPHCLLIWLKCALSFHLIQFWILVPCTCIWLGEPRSHTEQSLQGVWETELLAFCRIWKADCKKIRFHMEPVSLRPSSFSPFFYVSCYLGWQCTEDFDLHFWSYESGLQCYTSWTQIFCFLFCNLIIHFSLLIFLRKKTRLCSLWLCLLQWIIP